MAGPSESNSWSALPNELLELIFTSTKYPGDIIRCSAVCLSWHSVASSLYRKVFPFFIVQTQKEEACFGGRTLFNISPQGPRKINLPEESSPAAADKPFFCAGADNGWLLTVASNPPYEINLLNPFSGFRVLLPQLFPITSIPPSAIPGEWTITAVKVSSCPSRQLCFVLVTYLFGLRGVICRPGDARWKDIDPIGFEDVMIYNDSLYAIYPGRVIEEIFSCKINYDSENPTKMTGENWRIEQIPSWVDNPVRQYTVISVSGEFWLVKMRFLGSNNREKDGIESFRVFKRDVEENNWTRVYDLGRQALVITETPRRAVSIASGTSATSFKKNCIYYVDELIKRGRFYVREYNFETMHSEWLSVGISEFILN